MDLSERYKETEIGVIPLDWEVDELSAFVRDHNSGVYKKSDLYGYGSNIIGVSDLYNVDVVDGQCFSHVPLSSAEVDKYTLRAGDLLYGESSLVREGIARTVWVSERGSGTAFAWHTRRYSLHQNRLLPSFLAYFLESQCARRHMMDHSIQTAITGINTVAYFACPVACPSLAEQHAISETLLDLDAAKAALSRLIAKKQDLRQAAMQRLLTGQIRLPGFESKGRFKDTVIGAIPDDWNLISLDQAFDIQLGKMLDAERNTGEPKPYLGNRAVQWGRIEATELPRMRMTPADMSKFRLEAGDLLVCEGGEVGRCAIYAGDPVECYYQKALHRLRPRGEVDPRLLVFLFRRYSDLGLFANFVTQTSIAHLPKEKLALVPVLQIDDTEQQAILNVFRDADAEVAALEAKLAKYRGLKQGMMQSLLTGRVRLLPPRRKSRAKVAAHA